MAPQTSKKLTLSELLYESEKEIQPARRKGAHDRSKNFPFYESAKKRSNE